jgi:hypothetical protein
MIVEQTVIYFISQLYGNCMSKSGNECSLLDTQVLGKYCRLPLHTHELSSVWINYGLHVQGIIVISACHHECIMLPMWHIDLFMKCLTICLAL